MALSKKLTISLTVRRRTLLILIVPGILLYIAIPQLQSFHSSLTLLRQAMPMVALLATLVSLMATVIAAVKYQILALQPLTFGRTLLVQFAGLFAGRLLPVGLGGLGINYAYLRKAGHKSSQSAVVVTVNNLLGFIGHFLLLLALLPYMNHKPSVALPRISFILTISIAASLSLAAIIVWTYRKRIWPNIVTWQRGLLSYRKRPFVVLLAIGLSIVIATLNAACLWYSALAIGQPLSFVTILLVMTVGITASTIVPTPGGIFGVEAAMVGGLILSKVSPAEALAVVLLYRFITYWFALILGAATFIIVERRNII